MSGVNDKGKMPVTLFLLSVLFSISFYVGSCTQGTGTKETMTPERKKAIEDSLLKVREFEIAKSWSTGYEYYKNKNYSSAKRWFLKVLELDPNLRLVDKYKYNTIHGKLAQCYIDENKPDSTEWAFREGIKFFPENAYYLESLGYIARQKKVFDEAIDFYSKAAQYNPEKPELHKILGDLYYQQGDLDKAIEEYESYTKLNPGDRDAQEKLAAILVSAGRAEEAVSKKEELLKSNPDDTKLMMDLGRSYFRNFENEKAVAMFKRLLEKQPENIEALQYLAAAQMNLEQYNDAISTYKKLNSLNPNNVEVLCALAEAYKLKNQFATARVWARRAMNADPNSGLPHITLGNIYSAAAEYCASKKQKAGFDFNDKLVYELAYKEYQKAKKDPSMISEAEKRMEALQPYIPTKQDKFMHPNQKQAKGDCYKWIY